MRKALLLMSLFLGACAGNKAVPATNEPACGQPPKLHAGGEMMGCQYDGPNLVCVYNVGGSCVAILLYAGDCQWKEIARPCRPGQASL